MFKLLIDTMPIHELLTEQETNGDYINFAERIESQKITGVISAITLAELISHLGAVLNK